MRKLAAIGALLFVAPVVLAQALPSDAAGAEPAGKSVAAPVTYEEAVDITRKTPGYKNLQRIGLAIHGYHDIFGRYPAAVSFGPDGKIPHSWRVELLPMLKHYVDGIDRDALSGEVNRDEYNELIKACGYDVNEPWNSRRNSGALNAMPDLFRHPHDERGSIHSAYYAITGPGTLFDGSTIVHCDDIKGWVGSVLMIAESDSREPWTKPIDVVYIPEGTAPRLGGFTPRGFLALTADGAVHFIHDSARPADLRAVMTKDTGDSFSIPGIPFRWRD